MPPPGPQSWYQSLLRDTLAPALKLRGFKRSGSNFGLRGSGVWGVISLWRDSWNDRDHVEFSITLNLFSDVLYREFYRPFKLDLARVPSSAYWHYHRQFPGDIEIGPLRHLRPEGMDTLCLIRWRTDMSSVSDEILRVVLNHAVPWIRRHRTSRDMIALLRPSPRGQAWGNDLELAALLHEHGPRARFERQAAKLLRDSQGPFRQQVRRKLKQWRAECIK